MSNYVKTINPVISSLQQSICDCVETMLEEYKTIEPSFKYVLSYGSNFDTDCEMDTFNINLAIGSIDRIPCHYTKLRNMETILFAGNVDVSLSVLCPVPLTYKNDVEISTNNKQLITDDLMNQSDSNIGYYDEEEELDEISVGKIENTVRLMEGLSMFMYRKNMISNDFSLTFLTDMPLLTGVYENREYRFMQDLFISCKFKQLGAFNITSGEDVELYFGFKNNFGEIEWDKFECLTDFSFSFGAVPLNYPLASKSLVQTAINQQDLTLTISCPAITNIGANKKLLECVEKAKIEEYQYLPIRYSEDGGKTFKQTTCSMLSLDYPRNINAFGTNIYNFRVLEPILKVGD